MITAFGEQFSQFVSAILYRNNGENKENTNAL